VCHLSIATEQKQRDVYYCKPSAARAAKINLGPRANWPSSSATSDFYTDCEAMRNEKILCVREQRVPSARRNEKCRAEKIHSRRTIKGCEMCAGGVPAKNDTNLMNAAGHCTLVVADLKLIQDKVIKHM